ncbi:plasmid replication protein RepC [Rhizobium leguminosarum]|uniref:plasmid replication protein RepC n=1 Tax=Rhizobium leguminosarum TaxID=384 RepID=UPI001C95AC38|nr:plasmid replication protein RepC [Rhizobium leguminosarum]MBY5701089.1 replication initiation protein RepC [Rhizobium leguminosarum]
MQTGNVTTPFGRRPMTLDLVKRQLSTAKIKPGKSVDKWRVYRSACEARATLGLRDRALAVLNALLTFFPQQELSEESNLVVFPSNAQLAIRANGIAGTTLRENLARLVQVGLIQRNDSPNGKRYARKGNHGEIETAYGFSLAPLLARAEELAIMAQQVSEENRRLRIIKERITITRRDIHKLITAAVEEGAAGNWQAVEDALVSAIARLKAAKTVGALEACLDELTLLSEQAINMLKIQPVREKSGSNDSENRHHIQNSNTEPLNELEPRSRKEQDERAAAKPKSPAEPIKAFPLGMVLRACPQISDYATGGAISHWRQLMTAAVVVRTMLNVSPSAYQEACKAMGPENAAVAMACVLERAGHINSPGGYLRDLTRRAARGEFSLGPMLMALLRTREGDGNSRSRLGSRDHRKC